MSQSLSIFVLSACCVAAASAGASVDSFSENKEREQLNVREWLVPLETAAVQTRLDEAVEDGPKPPSSKDSPGVPNRDVRGEIQNLLPKLRVFRERNGALRALCDIGEPAIPELLRLLSEADDLTRTDVVEVLGTLRRRTIEKAKTDTTKELEARLLKTIDDPSDAVAHAAIRALTYDSPREKRAIPRLSSIATDKSKTMLLRGGAIFALGRFGKDASVAVLPLTRVLEDKGDLARGTACAALARIAPNDQTLAILRQILRDANESVVMRGHAAEALPAIGSGANAAVIDLLHVLNETAGVNRSPGRLRNNEYRFRSTALRTLCQLDPGELSLPTLVVIIQDANEEWTDRVVAAKAIGKVGPHAHAAVPHLVNLLHNRRNEETGLVIATVEALAEIGSAARVAVPLLEMIQAEPHTRYAKDIVADSIKKIQRQ